MIKNIILNSPTFTYDKSFNIDQQDLNVVLIDKLDNYEGPYKDAVHYRLENKEISKDANNSAASVQPKILVTTLPNIKGGKLMLIENISQDSSLIVWLESVAKWFKRMPGATLKNISIDATKTDKHSAQQLVRVIAGHFHRMPSYKKKAQDCLSPNITVVGYDQKTFSTTCLLQSVNAITRYLGIMPSNHLTAKKYISYLESFSENENFSFEFISKKKLEDMGAGAFSAVSRASIGGGIVKLNYRGNFKESSTMHLSLVGKGICFDTGGTCLKPSKYMLKMNEDMIGSAVAFSTFYVLVKQNVPLNIQCYLAITENNIDKHAYVPNEVVQAYNGLNIEVIDTDAEGRMVLADALSIASQEKPKMIIDFATLTGSAVGAIGTQYNAIFSNKTDWQLDLHSHGDKVAEPVWMFPIGSPYDSQIKSDIADIKQCSESPGCDHILAASFLSNFIDSNSRWLHVDLSSCNHKGGLGAITTDATGSGIWFAHEVVRKYFEKNIDSSKITR